MTLNKYQVVECPSCGTLHKMLKPKSKLKVFEIYSDGKTLSPELDEALEVATCVKCAELFWLEDVEKSGVVATEEMPSIKAPSIKQYVEMLDADVVTTDEEEILRMELLWAFNDRVRAGGEPFVDEGDKAIWEKNIAVLNKILDDTDIYSRLLKAELARECGDFDRAEAIVSKIKEGHLVNIKHQMLNAIHHKEQKVIKFEE